MLNVVLASDENFVPYLSVCIISLLKNNSNDFDVINLYVLDNGISEDSKNKLNDLINDYNANLEFIPTIQVDKLVDGVQVMEKCGLTSFANYSRLFLSSLLPKDIHKCLYLDADSLVVGSFKELIDINLEGYSTGAVLDVDNGIDIVKNNIGLNSEDNYYNSGFLLINLDYWRENDIESKFLNFLIKYKNKLYWHDQDVINGVLSRSIKTLNIKYNLFMLFHETKAESVIKLEGLTEFYDLQTIKSAQNNPVFLHFAGLPVHRPWFNKNLKYYELYEYYANLTPFYDRIFKNIKISKSSIFKDKIYKSNFLYFILSILPKTFCINSSIKRKTKIYKKF